jgi:hypothetical protein
MSEGAPRIADHPVAKRQVARIRAWAALVGFAAAFWLSHRAGMSFPQCGARAIASGIGMRLLAWGVTVAVWRQVIPAQVSAAARRRQLAAAEAAERLQRARASS